MSDEGEFKKIVMGHQLWKTGMDENQLIEYCYEPYIKLCAAIEKAHKEFEQLIFGTWSIEFDEKGETVYNPNASAPDSWVTPREAIKWFRKWFGKEEKK